MRYELPTEPPEEPEFLFTCSRCGAELGEDEDVYIYMGDYLGCKYCLVPIPAAEYVHETTQYEEDPDYEYERRRDERLYEDITART